MITKICSRCKTEKPISEYRKDKRKPLKIQCYCKKCANIINKNYRIKNAEKINKYNQTEERKNKKILSAKKYYGKLKVENPKKIKEIWKKGREKRNRENEKIRHALCRAKKAGFNSHKDWKDYKLRLKINKDWDNAIIVNIRFDENKKKLTDNEKRKILRQTNPQWRLIENSRARIRRILRHKSIIKTRSTFELIGCSGKELYNYLSIKGYNPAIHHVDHIVPMSKFNLKDDNHLCVACHYLNLQPLTAHDNNSKSDSLPYNWEEKIKQICIIRQIDSSDIINYINNN